MKCESSTAWIGKQQYRKPTYVDSKGETADVGGCPSTVSELDQTGLHRGRGRQCGDRGVEQPNIFDGVSECEAEVHRRRRVQYQYASEHKRGGGLLDSPATENDFRKAVVLMSF